VAPPEFGSGTGVFEKAVCGAADQLGVDEFGLVETHGRLRDSIVDGGADLDASFSEGDRGVLVAGVGRNEPPQRRHWARLG